MHLLDIWPILSRRSWWGGSTEGLEFPLILNFFYFFFSTTLFHRLFTELWNSLHFLFRWTLQRFPLVTVKDFSTIGTALFRFSLLSADFSRIFVGPYFFILVKTTLQLNCTVVEGGLRCYLRGYAFRQGPSLHRGLIFHIFDLFLQRVAVHGCENTGIHPSCNRNSSGGGEKERQIATGEQEKRKWERLDFLQYIVIFPFLFILWQD